MENQNPEQILKGPPSKENRPWWIWLIISLIVAAVIYLLVRFFILGQGPISPTPLLTVTPTPIPTETPEHPTLSPSPTPFEIEITQTPRTGSGD